jgi:hypothetical protein
VRTMNSHRCVHYKHLSVRFFPFSETYPTNEGRLEAKAKGVKFGRKPSVDKEKVRALYNQGIGATEISRKLKIGRSTVYKVLTDELPEMKDM